MQPSLDGHQIETGILQSKPLQDLQSALRRAGQNPTESEVQDMTNKIDDGSASLTFSDFCLLIEEKAKELDPETHFKDTFRVFSKDEEGDDNKEALKTNDENIVQDAFQLMR
jgi:Ca2+-binding EF-hand superfamily protein